MRVLVDLSARLNPNVAAPQAIEVVSSAFAFNDVSAIGLELGPGTLWQNDPTGRRISGDMALFEVGCVWVLRRQGQQPVAADVDLTTFGEVVLEQLAEYVVGELLGGGIQGASASYSFFHKKDPPKPRQLSLDEQWERFKQRVSQQPGLTLSYVDITRVRLFKGVLPSMTLETKISCWNSYWLELSGVDRSKDTNFTTLFRFPGSVENAYVTIARYIFLQRIMDEFYFCLMRHVDSFFDAAAVAEMTKNITDDLAVTEKDAGQPWRDVLGKWRLQLQKWNTLCERPADARLAIRAAYDDLAPMSDDYRAVPELDPLLKTLAAAAGLGR